MWTYSINCFEGISDSKCPVCRVPVNSRDSLEDKQLKDVLVQLNKLKNILEIEQNLNKNHASEDLETSKAKIACSDVSHGLSAVTNGNKMDSPKCSTPKTKLCKMFLSKNASKVSSSEESIVEETQENTSVKSLSKSAKKCAAFSNASEKKKLSSKVSDVPVQSPSNLNKKNHKGETLLHREVIKGNIDKVKKLLDDGALVNTQDNNGWTPLHEASSHGYVEIAKLLLDHGALVNVPSLKDNITPLHDALINEKMQIAILLVSRGADLHLKTSLGNTALDLCKTDEDRNILIDACSPFISSNILIPSDKVEADKNEKIVFLPTNLADHQKIQLQKCAQLLKADIVDEFNHNVSHIITSCDSMGNCTRTMKVLMGMLSGKWIINSQCKSVFIETFIYSYSD
ncbi:BRCA1-associated RING domain protein 1-like isoform X2 [Stegodyphus dumicola]|uniref:BRCA1-associated RING domain protein 1-like isoform X2 n=1 Tax=Stegodyphus dumicola TaxID=202533 RepID=UPI0015B19612|nr:BRCA1-associated RING domain protein 1-like isoform X2 [Stegodyphus dumicola]